MTVKPYGISLNRSRLSEGVLVLLRKVVWEAVFWNQAAYSNQVYNRSSRC